MIKPIITILISLLSFVTNNVNAQDSVVNGIPLIQNVDDFYAEVMNAPPFFASNGRIGHIGQKLPATNSKTSYLNSTQVDYFKSGWEQRIASDWQFFSAPKALGRILVIDYKATSSVPSSSLSYRYLANHDTFNDLYEPWSSSKIFAFTAAVAKVRQLSSGELGADSLAGNTPIADLITSIHSYAPFGLADGDSNAIASYFANVAGRDRISALLHDQWLRLANSSIRFRGAYANTQFTPSDNQWRLGARSLRVDYAAQSSDDLGYQPYRCEHCGLTGNKPMTTLAQAEWLKRLAVHDRDPVTRMPYLQSEDVAVLFFGRGHSDTKQIKAGMSQGISTMLHNAIATAIVGDLPTEPKKVLDDATQGQWQIWQKIGWGPSETRGSGENVVLAHVSLPYFQGGMEFTLAAQTAELGQGDIYVNYAGIKMQSLLTQSMLELFQSHQVKH